MKKPEKQELLLIAAALVIAAVICAFKVFDSPSYKALEATSAVLTHTTESAATGTVNINTATLEELMTLDEIGEIKARAIIDYREENGYFTSVDELTEVEGIGDATVETNRSRLTV